MGRPNSLAFVASVVAAAIVFLCSSAPADAKLKTTYYERTCPRLQEIVSRVVTDKQITNPTTAAGTLRLFFHDCFVGGYCDITVRISLT